MSHDLIIRNGTVVDGSGQSRFSGDIAIDDGLISRIGNISESAYEEIDATDKIVCPGFVDGHTHMDAQVFWEPLGTCSCYHGVTSVVMGNCGFTLAPVRASELDLVLSNLERAEAIPAAAMRAGIDFCWETFSEFFDALEQTAKGINYAGYVGHSALRTYAMGERAFSEPANNDELAVMVEQLENAMRAGAVGFSTSRNPSHLRADDRPVASRVATWDEVCHLVGAMGKLGGGIFEISREASGGDAQTQAEFSDRLKALTKEAGVVTTFGVFTLASEPGGWRKYMELIDEAATEGAQMFAQVHSNTMYNYYSFETRLPVDDLPQWKAVRRRPLDQQMRAFLDPSLRAALRTATDNASGTAATLEVEKLKVVYTMEEPNPTVGELARANSVHPVDALLDAALAADFALFFREPFANADQDDALELMRHPRSVVTFSDSGAHVTEIADSCLQTVLLSRWCRDRHAFTLEESVRKISFDVASHFGLRNRGLLREGYAGDVVVMDYDKLQPQMPSVVADLPTGAKRVFQGCDGIDATVVNGQILLRDSEHTGALPGRLLKP